MTIKEITSLRKSGHLEEAHQAAQNEFALNANNYTAGALFWCLNDMIKQQTGDEAEAMFQQMVALYHDYCPNDEYITTAINHLTNKRIPYSHELDTTIERARSSINIVDDYNEIIGAFLAGKIAPELHDRLGWVIYYALKQTPGDKTDDRKRMLSNYLKLNVEKPSKLHSAILSEAIQTKKSTPNKMRLQSFIQMWNLDKLRDEDWQQYSNSNGQTSSSLVEKLISACTNELKEGRAEAPQELVALVDKALHHFPNNQYLPYYKAIVLISLGKTEEALSYYKRLLLKNPTRYYLWEQSAELVDDTTTKIGLLCKALSCGNNDDFVGNIRLQLAELLIHKNLHSNAKYECEKYLETYRANGWNVKPKFHEVNNRLVGIELATSNKAIYEQFAITADEFIYSSLPTEIAVKLSEAQSDDKNHPGRKVTVWTLATGNTIMRLRKPSKFGLNKRTENGATFDIKTLDNKIVWIKEHVGPINTSWLKECYGQITLRNDRNGHNYAIISGTYIGANLLKNVTEGQYIKFLSYRQSDGRWKAISIRIC